MRSRHLPVALLAFVCLVAGSCSSSSKSSSPPPPPPTTIPPAYSARVVSERVVDPAYRQGVARAEDGWAFSLNDGLYLTDLAFKQTKKLGPAIPAQWTARGFNHIGDIDIEGGVLYAPLEQPKYELGRQAMLTYDAATLEYNGGKEVAQHEASFVTVDPATKIAYSMDRFGGNALLRYDVAAGWRLLEPLRMSRTVERVQGGDVRDGAVWLSTDDATDGVYRVALDTGQVQSLGSIGRVDGEGEGIDATPTPAGDLHVLTVDVNVVPVRLIELKVSSSSPPG